MFTGIIETLGTVKAIDQEQENYTFTIQADFTKELKVDQSVAHNGVCLTVIDRNVRAKTYKVVAIKETLELSNLKQLEIGDLVNLERCLPYNGRLDGHFVQGHVDTTGVCKKIKEEDGSWVFTFEFASKHQQLLVNKGSVTINGVSLTVINPKSKTFKVAIIPYTYEHTVFKTLNIGDAVNLEFDILGKYIQKHLSKLN